MFLQKSGVDNTIPINTNKVIFKNSNKNKSFYGYLDKTMNNKLKGRRSLFRRSKIIQISNNFKAIQ